jgi:acetyl esterase/lipase
MDHGRRMILTAGLALTAGATRAGRDARADSPTPADNDADAPVWPPAERLALWPAAPPGAPATLPVASLVMDGARGARQLQLRGIAHPELNVFRAPRPDGTGLLVFPGGGYRYLSLQNEGLNVASRFTPFGTTVFIVTYRLPGEGWQHRERVPLQDAQRAVRLVRHNAAGFGVDSARIGVLGFSAGGHAAAELATAFAEQVSEPVDGADILSARPDFAGLLYAVTNLGRLFAFGQTPEALLGAGASDALVAQRSPVAHVRADTPPCFIAHAMDDKTVSPESSLDMIAACRRAGVAVEGHLFESGGHGFGLQPAANLPAARWPDLFESWMRARGTASA